MAAPNLSEITTTTIRNRSRMLADNVSNNNALLYVLKEQGNMKTVDGGETILQEIEYAENATYKRYTGYEVLNISPSEVFTSAEYGWKQVSVAVTMSGLEEMKNSGREKMIDLISSRIKNAEHTMMNGLDEDIFSSGTADGGKQITGLGTQVPAAPSSGMVGGINRATWDFWRSESVTASTAGSIATEGNLQTRMNAMYSSLTRQNDSPNIIVADNAAYDAFLGTLQDQQRFTSTQSNMAKRGFETIRFRSADVVLAGGKGGNADERTMLFLNTKFLFWRPHKNRNMVPLNADRYATNQDAVVKLIGWGGNLTSSNLSSARPSCVQPPNREGLS